ncbi:hypothetical protein ACJMK2_011929 [Sinanodonta woodiana]|uniref:ShKT domain-containing protein n=1 Tax=Sinanodonta woodiana TaxID=1069815 RepID=A0ABD3V6K0_SINWO
MDRRHEDFYLLFILVLTLVRHLVSLCVFPEYLQPHAWHTHIRTSTGRRTAVNFREHIMEMQEQDTETGRVFYTERRLCENLLDRGRFFIKHRDNYGQEKFGCIEFVIRSRSITQIKMSHLTDKPLSSSCDENEQKWDPWLLVSYPLMKQEFTTCPLSGGYNMKIKDGFGNVHGCNFMNVPMRFESECLTGEGITFDFRSSDCSNFLPMDIVQKAVCIAHWSQEGNVYIVLRKSGQDDLWCLRFPPRTEHINEMFAYLYTDLACVSPSSQNNSAMNYTLLLETIFLNNLCSDEHSNCAGLPCNEYIKQQCPKTCRACDPNISPPTCSFPRRLLGEWLLRDQFGAKYVNLSESYFHIESFGTFKCVSFLDSPSRDERLFTTLSLFTNGCRPKLTCVGFHKFSRSVMGYSLSQSDTWSIKGSNLGTDICNRGRFQPDPAPITDTYRTFRDIYKPILQMANEIPLQPCGLKNSYIFNAVFADGNMCQGLIYPHCRNDTKIRIEFKDCNSIPDFVDYKCAAVYKGHYWEKIVLMENINDLEDVRCLIFSDLEPKRILMLHAAQCDKYSWTYTNAKMRIPIIDFNVTVENLPCRTIPMPTELYPIPVNDGWQGNSNDEIPSHHIVESSVRFAPTSPRYHRVDAEKKGKHKENVNNKDSKNENDNNYDTVHTNRSPTSCTRLRRFCFISLLFVIRIFIIFK